MSLIGNLRVLELLKLIVAAPLFYSSLKQIYCLQRKHLRMLTRNMIKDMQYMLEISGMLLNPSLLQLQE